MEHGKSFRYRRALPSFPSWRFAIAHFIGDSSPLSAELGHMLLGRGSDVGVELIHCLLRLDIDDNNRQLETLVGSEACLILAIIPFQIVHTEKF